MLQNILLMWSASPSTSLAIWAVLAILILYLGRQQAHQAISALGNSIYRFMRASSRSLANIERQLRERNKSVILGRGQEVVEATIEREFVRINDVVTRDLSHYPSLHRELTDAIATLERDYQSATEAPPTPPEWLNVVQTISDLPTQADPMVANILGNIRDEVQTSYEKTLKLYQKTSAERHRLLSAMQPQWRGLTTKLDKTKDVVASTQERANTIDKHMADYQAIRNQEDDIVRQLSASSLTQFFIAGLVLVVATLGGLINFQLIALPMSEMVGGGSNIGGWKTSDVAALVIILIEIAMGLFLLDSLRITHLFPVISHMDDRMRKRMVIISFSILFILASIEASLAYMRDLLALDREALTQSLSGVAVTHTEFRWIPSVGQMVMGFIIPFALAFVAIPLESFIHSSRTVIGTACVAVLRLVAIVCRLIGGFARQTCKILVHVYDVVITVPLSIEALVNKTLRSASQDSDVATDDFAFNEYDDSIPEPMIENPEEAKPKRGRKRRNNQKIDPELTITDA